MKFKQQKDGFTLTELLVVIALMTILVGVSAPSIPGLMRSNKFDEGLTALSQTLNQARQYAIGNNTYVWVLLNSPATSGSIDQPLKVAVVASLNGTDVLNWSHASPTASIPPTSTTDPGTNLQMISVVQNLHGVNIQDTYPSTITFTSTPPSTVVPLNKGMTINVQTGGQTTSYTYAIEFTPMGEALVSSSMARYIQFVLYPQQGGTSSKDQAALCVAGLTGATSVYRN